MDQLLRYKTPEEVAKMQATMRARKKTCTWCGTEFVARKSNALYCSSNCRLIGHRQHVRERVRRWRQAKKEEEASG